VTKRRSSRPDKKRPDRRQIAAAATRREILLAARRLFAAKGYAATSIVDIADDAGVSVPTIYTSVGTKKEIVFAIAQFIGEEAGSMDAQSALATETDPARAVALAAHVNRNLVERCGDILTTLLSASHVEPDVTRAVELGRSIHRHGVDQVVARLQSLGALKTSAEEATAVVSLLTSIETYEFLRTRHGWSFDEAERWITSTLKALVLRQ